jgi:succinate dehydrogenase/fumarate reductase flavoprotein subunit
MKNKDESNKEPKQIAGMTRRDFLHDAGLVVGGLGVMTAVGGCVTDTAASTGAASAPGQEQRVTQELPVPKAAAPAKTEYSSDLLVVGGGFAGLSAAVAAQEAGKSVILVDKGRPGYSGLTPWASSHRWFDEELGDDRKAFMDCIRMGGEYITNMDWYGVWLDESKAAYEQLKKMEILLQYPKGEAGDHWKNNDLVGYREKYANQDRRIKWVKALEERGIEYVDYTMITNVLTQGGKAIGAMGFHVPSGVILTFNAKAIVMCTGGGSYKPTGYPVGGVSFDGEYIAYNLGLPIANKEFDDFHMTLSYAPGNALPNNSWPYLENIWLCGGDVTASTATEYVRGKAIAMVLDRLTKAGAGLSNNDGTALEDVSQSSVTRKGGSASGYPDDPRQGKDSSPYAKGDIYGAAVGMCSHMSSGVFCGLNDLVGYSGLPGLYYAGDGSNASAACGAMYPTGVGFTSSLCTIQGRRAAEAAANYADTTSLVTISANIAAGVIEEIQAPLKRETGFDPNWARDELQAVMSPYWINVTKTEATLKGALSQVEYMRDAVVPKLMAQSSHDLRLCHEMKHKVLSAEMKLRAGLERQESRGFHYRSDYPFRDDKNFLCYITMRKDANGAMTLSRVPVKDEWKGDLTQSYTERYIYRFPGEAEALGLPTEETSGRGR